MSDKGKRYLEACWLWDAFSLSGKIFPKTGYEDYEITPTPLTEKNIRIFNQLLNNAIPCDKIENKYMDIITEEAMLYFAGQQTIDDTIQYINGRVKTALKE